TETDNVSGRLTLRLPKSIHAKCIKAAESDGVSLNTYLTT
ncbi:toxin-antitoxin system HicB family antitoxin, partial [Proteus mirabilis]